jgi:Zn-dependent peptidase ImmA (M78 family)
MSYIANPMSRNSIRNLVALIREQVGLADERYFPVVEFLELGLPQLDESFIYEVVSKEDMGDQYGVTYPEKKMIVLREDVYDRAVAGVARDRFTIAHEIGHYIMHRPGRIEFARENRKGPIVPYKNPEWQANTFAGELLAPPNIIKKLSPQEIAKYCGVSLKVGEIQLSNI